MFTELSFIAFCLIGYSVWFDPQFKSKISLDAIVFGNDLQNSSRSTAPAILFKSDPDYQPMP